MPSVYDVAAIILARGGEMTTWKLHKLLYYVQAWSLAWDGAPLFDSPIEAWDDGPVVRAVYEKHRGQRTLGWLPASGATSKLTQEQERTVAAVLDAYGARDGDWLGALTHREAPWLRTYDAKAPDGRSRPISLDSLRDYYGMTATNASSRACRSTGRPRCPFSRRRIRPRSSTRRSGQTAG